jgi:hypothetical protein
LPKLGKRPTIPGGRASILRMARIETAVMGHTILLTLEVLQGGVYLVLKYPDCFSKAAVAAARTRLDRSGIVVGVVGGEIAW